jgi:hypothetical protein
MFNDYHSQHRLKKIAFYLINRKTALAKMTKAAPLKRRNGLNTGFSGNIKTIHR